MRDEVGVLIGLTYLPVTKQYIVTADFNGTKQFFLVPGVRLAVRLCMSRPLQNV